MQKNKIFLIDASAFCYRAFYALQGLSTSFGQPTGAIYGFVTALQKILRDNHPQYVAVCFDVSRQTFRQKKFAAYKIQRPPMPEGLSSQMPFIKEIIRALGIAVFEKEGFEADDIIATLNKKAKKNRLGVVIVSPDKDMLQLVDEDTVVLSPHKDGDLIYERSKVAERFKVEPHRIVDIVALMGDSVDNIPGIPGIGEKTAVDLISRFGSLDKLLQGLESVRSEKIREAIGKNEKLLRLNRELAGLDDSVDVDFDREALKIKEPNTGELARIFRHLEFKGLLKEVSREDAAEDRITIERLKKEDAEELLKEPGELVLSGDSLEKMVFSKAGRFFRTENPARVLGSFLKDRRFRKVGHDLKKVILGLAAEDACLSGVYFDTMIASYVLDPSRPSYLLADLAWYHLNEAPSQKSLSEANCLDLILRLRPVLESELKEKSLFKLFEEIEMPLVDVLAEMEMTGIKIDPGLLKEISVDMEGKLIKLIEGIYEISGCQFNINSPKQLRQVLFERLKLPVVKRSKTGPSTDEEVLNKLSAGHKLPALLLEYRQLAKLKSTYVDALPQLLNQRTGRIHTTFNQTGTETGRLSSANPNLQNIPVKTDIGRQIRRAVVAFDKDSYLLSCDYSQVELRILAHISQDKNLKSAFEKGEDIHRATAGLVYGIDEDSVSDKMRETAKRVNFGIVYGLSAYGLSRDLGIPLDQAQSFIDAYFNNYPGVRDYIEQQIKKAEKDGFVTTILGRRRYLPQINDKSQGIRQFSQRQAVNSPIQGSASDLIKLAMIDISGLIKARGLASRMILQIHDELLFNVPEGEMKDFSVLVKERMENTLKLSVPIKVDIKKGRNWLEMEEIR